MEHWTRDTKYSRDSKHSTRTSSCILEEVEQEEEATVDSEM